MTMPPPSGTNRAPLPASSPLSEDESNRLLRRLLQARWQRLRPECDNPLNMLYDLPANEWTLGWDPVDETLYLILWAKASWRHQPHWALYINGEQRHLCEDGALSPLAGQFRRIFTDDVLTFQSIERLLDPLVDYSLSGEQREQRIENLCRTLKAFPAAWSALRGPFLSLLGRDLSHDNWPMLDVLKIHRLDQKVQLLHCLKTLVQSFIITDSHEKDRIHQLIEQVHEGYEELGQILTPLVRPEYEASYRRFRHLIYNGFWRLRLAKNQEPDTVCPRFRTLEKV